MEVFLTSPWIPAEWIKACGLEPRGLWSAKDLWHGALPLSGGVCAFAEAGVKYAKTHPASLVVFATTCDQLRRGFDAFTLRASTRTFLFNLPATWQTKAAKQIFRSELERLGRFLLDLSGQAPTADRLRSELLDYGQNRDRLLAAASSTSARPFAEAVARFHWDGTFSLSQHAAPEGSVPLALVGGPFSAQHWPLLEAIEAAGARVALNATETGERSLCPAFESAATEDPFEVLVKGYFENIIDVFQRPNTRLYSWLLPRLRSRKVAGIVLWHFTNCDLWRAEWQTLRETFDLPVLLLEAGEAPGISPRELNRIQAFVETLK